MHLLLAIAITTVGYTAAERPDSTSICKLWSSDCLPFQTMKGILLGHEANTQEYLGSMLALCWNAFWIRV